ncbi:MAG: hypothetical protein WD490_06620 [Opitutales bacterium]
MINDILVLHHSHYDRGYMHPPEMEDLHQADFIRQAIEWCERNPEGKWTAEVTRPVKCFLAECRRRREPEWIERLTRLAGAGRFGIGALALHATPLCDALELADLVADVPELRRVTSAPIRVAFQHDINGMAWPISDGLLDQGVELLITGINLPFGNVAVGRFRHFRWQTPTGRHLEVFNGEHYGAINRELNLMEGTVSAMQKGWAVYAEKMHSQGNQLPFAYMTASHTQPGDCNPPDEELLPLIRAWNGEKAGPRIRWVTGEDLLVALRAQAREPLATFVGDWTDWWNFGCASTPMHTALARAGRRRLRMAELLATQPINPPQGWEAARAQESAALAREQLLLWNEHTWGSYEATEAPDSPSARLQNHQKQSLAHLGFAAADAALRLRMEALATNPSQARGFAGCWVFNSHTEAAVIHPWVPKDWLLPHAMHNRGWMLHQTAKLHYTRVSDRHQLPPQTLAATSWEFISFAAPLEPAPAAMQHGPDFLQSPHHRLEFDPVSGNIRSIVRRADACELLPQNSTWPWASPVFECPDPDIHPSPHRETIFNPYDLPGKDGAARPRWQATRTMGVSQFKSVELCGHTLWLARSHELPRDVRLNSTIGLSASSDEITLRWHLTLPYVEEPWALYAVFPTRLGAGWGGTYDTAGRDVRYDDEQLPGACRDYITIDTAAGMHDAENCWRMRSTDVPMVMLGDFHFRSKLMQPVDRPPNPLLISWVANNYWFTNFPCAEPGTVRLVWKLRCRPQASKAGVAPAWEESELIHPSVLPNPHPHGHVSL